MSKARVYLATPTIGSVDPRAMASLLAMSFYNGQRHREGKFEIIDHGIPERIQVAHARTMLAEEAVKRESTHILFIDDDMIVPHDILERLLSHGKPVVAALAFTRNPPFHPVLYKRNPIAHVLQFAPILDYDKKKDKKGLVRCDAVGFGTCLVETRVLDRITKPWFWYGDNYGEDIFFCDKAVQSRVPVHMDVETEVGHVGANVIVREEQFRALLERCPPEQSERLVFVGDKFHIKTQEHGRVEIPDPTPT